MSLFSAISPMTSKGGATAHMNVAEQLAVAKVDLDITEFADQLTAVIATVAEKTAVGTYDHPRSTVSARTYVSCWQRRLRTKIAASSMMRCFAVLEIASSSTRRFSRHPWPANRLRSGVQVRRHLKGQARRWAGRRRMAHYQLPELHDGIAFLSLSGPRNLEEGGCHLDFARPHGQARNETRQTDRIGPMAAENIMLAASRRKRTRSGMRHSVPVRSTRPFSGRLTNIRTDDDRPIEEVK